MLALDVSVVVGWVVSNMKVRVLLGSLVLAARSMHSLSLTLTVSSPSAWGTTPTAKKLP